MTTRDPRIRDIARRATLSAVRSRRGAPGSDAPSVGEAASDDRARSSDVAPFDPGAAPVIEALAATLLDVRAHPDAVENELADLLAGCAQAAVAGEALRGLVRLAAVRDAPPLRETLLSIFGASRYLTDILVRNPGLAAWLMEARTWHAALDADAMRTNLTDAVVPFRSVDARLDALRRAHRRLLLLVGARDLVEHDAVEDTARRLADLAQAAVACALDVVLESMADSRPARAGAFSVIALGKLGGRELNYSSDIDLVYVCEDGDDDALAWHTRVARRLTDALSRATAEGYLYRVDLRLRPDGVSGPIVAGESAMRLYYERRARPWEFQAMLKARVIAGDAGPGRRLLDAIARMTFSTSLSYSPVDAIASMRAQIRDALTPDPRGFDIKLMEGGIRDVEFVVQTLQLVHGGSREALRVPGTLEALDGIEREGLLPHWQVENLAAAYRFFRLVEHRLQMMHQIRTHTVPTDAAGIEALAARVSSGPLGRYDGASFVRALAGHLGNVRAIAEAFFEGADVHPHTALLMLTADDDRVDRILAGYGIREPRRAIGTLHAMAYGTFPRLLDRDARRAFEGALPHVLEAVAPTGDPDRTLVHLAAIAAAGRSEAAFYRRFVDDEAARDFVVAVAALSSRLTRALCRHVDLVDALPAAAAAEGFAAQFRALPDDVRYDPGLAARGGDEARRRREHQQAWFERAALQVFATQWQRRFSARVGGASRALVAARQVAAALDATLPARGVAVFALGSYATEDARPSSDLDLVVVTDGVDAAEVARGVQAINRWFGEGGMLRIDFRLRGEGAGAPLAQDLSFYRDYFERRLATWERVALMRCRPWWGDRDVQRAFLDLVHDAVFRPFDAADLATLVDVRRRLEATSPRRYRVWDTRRAPGGRYDVEYVTAVGLAACPPDDVPVPTALSMPERLRHLARRRLLSSDEFATLTAAFELYQRVELLMDLQETAHPRSAERHAWLRRYLDRTFAWLGAEVPGGVEQALERTRGAVRHVYQRVLSRSLD